MFSPHSYNTAFTTPLFIKITSLNKFYGLLTYRILLKWEENDRKSGKFFIYFPKEYMSFHLNPTERNTILLRFWTPNFIQIDQ
jgi:hypothetical protein